VNYLREINAFYDWLETNSMSASCIVLWHALMAIANKTGWAPEFAVAISTLETKTGLKKKTIERCRNTLKQKGLINWKERGGSLSAVYSINSLCVKNDPQDDPQNVPQNDLCVKNDPQTVSQYVPQTVSQPVSQSVAINKTKLNKTKQEIKKIIYSDFVTMTQEEHDRLVAEFGEPLTRRMIEVLNNYKGATGKKYKSDYLAIRNWVIDRVLKEEGKNGQSPPYYRADGTTGRKSITGGRIGWINRPPDA
jgi:hypothetical protein